MGIFDYIKFEDQVSIPKPENFNLDLKDLEFQTKSFDPSMSLYIVKNDGSLYQEGFFNDKKEVQVNFHGKVIFYAYHQTDLADYILDYEAKFTDGLLKEIKLINYEVVEHESLKLKREKLLKEINKENNRITRKLCFLLSKIFIIYPLGFFGIKVVTLSPGSFRGKNYLLTFHKPEIIFGYKKDSFKRKIYGISFNKITTELCVVKASVSKEFSFKILGFGIVLSIFEKINFEITKGEN